MTKKIKDNQNGSFLKFEIRDNNGVWIYIKNQIKPK